MTHTDDLLAREAELRDLLERSMTGASAPSELGSHALRHGRRLRTRRRVGLAAGAVAASAAAVLVLPVALGGGATTVTDPAGRPSSAATATAPAPEPATTELPDGWWNLPATDMIATIEAILPDGITVTSPGPLTADTPEGGPAAGWINATLSSPSGAGRLNMLLYPTLDSDAMTLTPEPGTVTGSDPTTQPGAEPSSDHGGDNVTPADEGAPTTGADPADEGEGDAVELGNAGPDISCDTEMSGRTQCTQIHDESGAIIGRRLVVHWGKTVTNEVVLRRNGGTIYAAAANTLDDKWGAKSPAVADQPPLTLDQLEDLVRNDTWVSPAT